MDVVKHDQGVIAVMRVHRRCDAHIGLPDADAPQPTQSARNRFLICARDTRSPLSRFS